MAMFAPVPRAEIERVAREGYRQQYGAGGAPRPSVRPRNIHPTLVLVDGERVEIPYRGRVYEILPVSFTDGLKLTDVSLDLDELADAPPTRENRRRYVLALKRIVALAPKYLRPRGRARRIFWRFHRNPFRGATDREVGELLGFFLGCRMRSRVQYPST